MIGIIGAMVPEVQALQQQLKNPTVTTISGIDFHKGTLNGVEVVIAQCGIGKVFAALCAESMILTFHPDAVINTGVAGALHPSLSVGDVVIAGQVVQHDMDTTPFGDPPGLISGLNIVEIPACPKTADALEKAVTALGYTAMVGTVASGDQFLSDPAKKASIYETFHALGVEMEGAAIGQVCYVNNLPFGVLRVISDSASGDGAMEYSEFLSLAANRSTNIIHQFLKQTEE